MASPASKRKSWKLQQLEKRRKEQRKKERERERQVQQVREAILRSEPVDSTIKNWSNGWVYTDEDGKFTSTR